MRRGPVVVLLVAALAVALPAQASACGPGKYRKKYLVAAGTSLHGVPWRITARRISIGLVNEPQPQVPHGVSSDIELDFVTVGYPQSGFSAILPMRIPHSYLFTAIGGSYVDPAPESDLAGQAAKRVVSLVVSFQVGDPVTIYPQLAPAKLRRDVCWTRRLRFFDAYFEDAPVPIQMSALDAAGRTLATKKPTGGSFF
jgi:hypothetical protein